MAKLAELVKNIHNIDFDQEFNFKAMQSEPNKMVEAILLYSQFVMNIDCKYV